jgi:hypothetical protein
VRVCATPIIHPSSFFKLRSWDWFFTCNPTLLSNTHHPSFFKLRSWDWFLLVTQLFWATPIIRDTSSSLSWDWFFACNPTLLIIHSPGRMDKDLATFFFCFMKLFSEAPLIVKSYNNTMSFSRAWSHGLWTEYGSMVTYNQCGWLWMDSPMMSKNIELFIGVFSTSENFDRRMAIRTTWMQYPLIRNGTIVVRFFIGMVCSFHQILLLLVHFL